MNGSTRNSWAWQFESAIPSDSTSGRQFLNEVLQRLETERWPQHEVFGVHLAVEEALVNAIRHGNHLDSRKHVHVVCRLSSERIHIEITDEGRGFDPAELPDPTCPEQLGSPGGRGVMLMKAFMSRVEYNAIGNSVILEKERGRG